MSISEQVKKLREIAKNFSEWEYNRFYDTISRAADTIESLSAKLQTKEYCDGCPGADIIEIPCTEECKRRHFKAENMERSAEDCGGGWILCSERMPEENEEVICCFKSGVVKALVLFNCKFHGKVYAYEKSDIIAWQPLPEPYHEP